MKAAKKIIRATEDRKETLPRKGKRIDWPNLIKTPAAIGQ